MALYWIEIDFSENSSLKKFPNMPIHNGLFNNILLYHKNSYSYSTNIIEQLSVQVVDQILKHALIIIQCVFTTII